MRMKGLIPDDAYQPESDTLIITNILNENPARIPSQGENLPKNQVC